MSTTPQDWRKLYAFGLPAGSVRALLALAVFATIWAWLLLRPTKDVPEYLQNLLFIIMGHYFAARKEATAAEEIGPPPLFLPTGSVRLMLIGGFVVVVIVLFAQDAVWLPHAGGERIHQGALTLLLVAGFLFGVLVSRVWAMFLKGRPLPRWVEDTRALISLAAAVLLVLMVFDLIDFPDWEFLKQFRQLAEGNGIKGALAAVVGFYFGSRS